MLLPLCFFKKNPKNYYIMVLILFGIKMLLKKKEKANIKIKNLSEVTKNKSVSHVYISHWTTYSSSAQSSIYNIYNSCSL